MYYFWDHNIYYQGKRQPPRQVELVAVYPNRDGITATCYDKDGDEYTLCLTEILKDNC